MSGSQGAGAASVSSVAASLTSFDGLRYKQGENYDRSLRWQNMKIIENIVQISVHLSAFFFRCSGYFPTILACYRCSTYTRLSSLLLLISFAILIEPFFANLRVRRPRDQTRASVSLRTWSSKCSTGSQASRSRSRCRPLELQSPWSQPSWEHGEVS